MVIVRVDGIDYVTTAGFLMQSMAMVEMIQKLPQFLINRSEGLQAAMLAHPDTWACVAITADLKKQYESKGVHSFNKEYDWQHPVWKPAEVTG